MSLHILESFEDEIPLSLKETERGITWALGVMSKEKSVEENKKEDFSLPGDRQSGCGQ